MSTAWAISTGNVSANNLTQIGGVVIPGNAGAMPIADRTGLPLRSAADAAAGRSLTVSVQDGATATLLSIGAGPLAADGIAPGAVAGVVAANAYQAGFNGANFDRLRTAQALDAGAGLGILATHVVRLLSNNLGVAAGSIQDVSVAASRTVSAANAQNQVVIELRNVHDVLDILMVASAGTATLTVESSVDNVNWIAIDNVAAALTTAKHYNNSTLGAATALTPLAFRYVRITAGAAGAGNTTTLTVAAK